MIQTYKNLHVWKKSMNLCILIYHITETFPQREIYGLTSQIRRSAVSIPSNIAEGYNRGHRSEYIQFLRISYGSGAELETQLIIAHEIRFISEEKFNLIYSLLQEVMKMLTKLLAVLQSKPNPHPIP